MEKLNVGPKSSLQGKVSNLSTARAYLLACSLLLLAMFLLVGVLLVSIAEHLNHDAGEHSRIDIENALLSVERVAGSTVKDYAFWGMPTSTCIKRWMWTGRLAGKTSARRCFPTSVSRGCLLSIQPVARCIR